MIDTNTFKNLVKTDLNPEPASRIIRRSYCIPLKVRGYCTANCIVCKKNLQIIVNRTDSEDARNRYALLQYWARQAVLDIDDESEKPKGVERDWLGQPVQREHFTDALREIFA
jgi:hypothetical protein